MHNIFSCTMFNHARLYQDKKRNMWILEDPYKNIFHIRSGLTVLNFQLSVQNIFLEIHDFLSVFCIDHCKEYHRRDKFTHSMLYLYIHIHGVLWKSFVVLACLSLVPNGLPWHYLDDFEYNHFSGYTQNHLNSVKTKFVEETHTHVEYHIINNILGRSGLNYLSDMLLC